jgi:hypothetical protein
LLCVQGREVSSDRTTGGKARKGGGDRSGGGRGDEFAHTDRFDFEDEDDEFGPNSGAPAAILKLPVDADRRGSSPQEGRRKKGGAQPGKSKGLEISLSPTGSQGSASVSNFLLPSPSPAKAEVGDQAQEREGPNRSREGSPPTGGSQRRTQSSKAQHSGKLRAAAGAEDVKLPMFKFDPLRGSGENPADGADAGPTDSAKQSTSLSKKFRSSFGQEQRTDVNDKATFLEPPAGKFRREFSNDHPLAKGGTGKYLGELKKGVTPAGLHVEVPEHMKRQTSNVADTLGVASKVERLTYTAQKRVVDPKSQIDELKRQQNQALKRINAEEREAEAVTEQTLRSIADPRERQNLEGVRALLSVPTLRALIILWALRSRLLYCAGVLGGAPACVGPHHRGHAAARGGAEGGGAGHDGPGRRGPQVREG